MRSESFKCLEPEAVCTTGRNLFSCRWRKSVGRPTPHVVHNIVRTCTKTSQRHHPFVSQQMWRSSFLLLPLTNVFKRKETKKKQTKMVQHFPCAKCQVPSTNCCSKCRRVYYCSREHQKADWTNHKTLCGPPFKVCDSYRQVDANLNRIFIVRINSFLGLDRRIRSWRTLSRCQSSH